MAPRNADCDPLGIGIGSFTMGIQFRGSNPESCPVSRKPSALPGRLQTVESELLHELLPGRLRQRPTLLQ